MKEVEQRRAAKYYEELEEHVNSVKEQAMKNKVNFFQFKKHFNKKQLKPVIDHNKKTDEAILKMHNEKLKR